MPRLEVTKQQMTRALITYTTRPDVVDDLLRLVSATSPELGRIEAEALARRTAMSACLSLACGLSTESDATLQDIPEWVDLLDKLLNVYDTTEKPEG